MHQGSCLGPLLFLFYSNGLPQAVKNSTVAMYADGTSFSYHSDDIHQLIEAKTVLRSAKAMVISIKQKERCSARNEELSLNIDR